MIHASEVRTFPKKPFLSPFDSLNTNPFTPPREYSEKKRMACAACKHQKRKCGPNCELAPYFPADKPEIFAKAHRLFGVSNIVKMLKNIDDHQKANAMKSIIFESEMRARFPAHGCLGVILDYGDMLKKSLKELDHVRNLLAYCKQHNLSYAPSTSSEIPSSTINTNLNTSFMDLTKEAQLNGDNAMDDNSKLESDGGVDAQGKPYLK